MGLLTAVDRSTKWVVSTVVFLIGAAYTTEENVLPPYYLLSALLIALAAKTVRHWLPSSRPPTSRKASSGMPSSHATSLASLSTIGVIAFWGYDAWSMRSTIQEPGLQWLWLLLLPALGIFLSTLRVTEGHHTTAQVLVGYVYGASAAFFAYVLEYQLFHVNSWGASEKRTLVAVALVCGAIAGVKILVTNT